MVVKVYLNISWTEEAIDPRCKEQKLLTFDHVGTIRLNLYSEVAPKTVENFRCLCTGEKGFGYLNSPFHRIIPNFMLVAGDITAKDGSGGQSIYGGNFDDECTRISHNKPGILSMINTGPNTNNSQFFITTGVSTWLDSRYVAFGEVADSESMNFVRQLECLGSLPNGDITVNPPPMITGCGQC